MPSVGNAAFLWVYPGARAGDFKYDGSTQPPQNDASWKQYFTNNLESNQTCSLWTINTASAVPSKAGFNSNRIRQHGVCYISASAGDVNDRLYDLDIREALQAGVTSSFGNTGSVYQPFPLQDDWSDGVGGGALIILTGSDAGPYKDGAPSGSLLQIIHTSDFISGSSEGLQVYNTHAEQFGFLTRTFPEIDAATGGIPFGSFPSGEIAISSCMLILGGIYLTSSGGDFWDIPEGMKGDETRGSEFGIYTMYKNGDIAI